MRKLERFNRLTDCESFLRGQNITQRNAKRSKYHAATPQNLCRVAETNAQEIKKMGAKSKT
jgi:hypothetical protein